MGKSNVSKSSFHLPSSLEKTQNTDNRILAKEVAIKSSKASVLRKMLHVFGGSDRNIGLAKFKETDRNGKTRKTLTVVARSMGQGVDYINLPPDIDKALTHKNHPRKRSHSEAILAALKAVGKLEINGTEVLDISGMQLAYTASTNEPCSDIHQQNCKDLAETFLGPMHYINPYSGKEDAHGSHALLAEHETLKDTKRGYHSDPDSDNEAVEKRIVIIKSRSLAGRNFTTDKSPIPATDYGMNFENLDLSHDTEH